MYGVSIRLIGLHERTLPYRNTVTALCVAPLPKTVSPPQHRSLSATPRAEYGQSRITRPRTAADVYLPQLMVHTV